MSCDPACPRGSWLKRLVSTRERFGGCPTGKSEAMGIIRKTASIATLGLVNWRSDKEKLRDERLVRAHMENALTETDESLRTSRRAARAARRRAERAEKRAEKAELEQLKLAKKSEHRRRLGRWRRKAAHESGQAKGGLRVLRRMGRRRLRRATPDLSGSSIQDSLPV